MTTAQHHASRAIVLIALGTRGDVQPYVALAVGLKAAGHHVRLLTSVTYASLAAPYNLDIWELSGDVHAAMHTPEIRALLAKGDFAAINAHTATLIEQYLPGWSATGHAACRGMDVIICGMGGLFLGAALSQSLHIPLIQAYLVPFTPTNEFPAVVLPTGIPSLFNHVSHDIFRYLVWHSFRRADTNARHDVLGIPEAHWTGPYAALERQHTPTLYGFSPSLLPKPADWGADVHVVGDWQLADTDWQPDPDLQAFLHHPDAPVYIGFGSMVDPKPDELRGIICHALHHCKLRAVVQGEWAQHPDITSNHQIHVVDNVPHTWLFPRMAAIVHHGGAGTSAAAVRAGVPNWVVAYFGDQPFWGRRMAQLGVGPHPQSRRTLQAMSAALTNMVQHQPMRQRAQQIGAHIAQEQGIATAIQVIERYLATVTQ